MHNLNLPLPIELRTATSNSTWEESESDYESPRAKPEGSTVCLPDQAYGHNLALEVIHYQWI